MCHLYILYSLFFPMTCLFGLFATGMFPCLIPLFFWRHAAVHAHIHAHAPVHSLRFPFLCGMQTIFLPVVGLVDADQLKPGDLVGVNKDS